jgi:hypothetical protein
MYSKPLMIGGLFTLGAGAAVFITGLALAPSQPSGATNLDLRPRPNATGGVAQTGTKPGITALFVSGGALLGLGVILTVVGAQSVTDEPPKRPEAQVSLHLLPNHASIQVTY